MSTPSAKSLLLKGATLLTHSDDQPPRVIPLFNHDLLIENGVIAGIGQDLQPRNPDAQVVDCAGKIVSPGFINTHVHLWQSQLKGRHSDDSLLTYFANGHFPSYVFEPQDTYIGQLAGCLEALDGGNTTVLDHDHGCQTTAHIEAALKATTESGIRAVWAYSEPIRLNKWNDHECEASYNYFDENITSFVESLVKKQNTPDAKVQVGLGFDLWFMPKEVTTPLFQRLTSAGVRTITSHVARDVIQGLGRPYSNIKDNHELFSADKSYLGFQHFVPSHSIDMQDGELELLKDLNSKGLNVSISNTPTTESTMCMHRAPAFTPQWPTHMSSLGVDCLSAGISYMPSIGTMLLNSVRIQSNDKYFVKDKYPLKMRGNQQEVFNMMTVYGARALGMDKKDGGIGRLEVGRKADIAVINTDRPGIGVAAVHNPLDALLGFSNAGDVEHVLVEGTPVKWNGKLLPVKQSDGNQLEWQQVSRDLFKSYRGLTERIEGLNKDKAREMMLDLFHVDTSKFVPGEQ